MSVLAHSLGSVLCYEILCNQPHLFDHLEFNVHRAAAPTDPSRPSDPSKSADTLNDTQQSTASEAHQRQQQPLQQQKRKASTEIAFAPMSSRDLEDSYEAARNGLGFPISEGPTAQPKAGPSLGMPPAWKGEAEVRLRSVCVWHILQLARRGASNQ